MSLKILFYFIVFLNKIVINYVVLPFNIAQKSINTSLDIKNQMELYLERNDIISTISFGEDKKGLELYLSLNEYAFFLSNDACLQNTNSSYNPFLSNSFQNTTDYIDLFHTIKKYCRAIEKCSFYNDINLNNNISINNLSFLFGVNSYSGNLGNSSKICGNLGLQIGNKNGNQFRNDYFVNSLKKSEIIDSYTWSILFLNESIGKNDILNYTNKNYDGILICGINEKDYFPIFKTDNIKTIKAEIRSSDIYWDIINIKVSYHFPKQNINDYEASGERITFNNEINYIICSYSYFISINETFFNKPIQDKICTIIERIKTMGSYIIFCDKKILEKISEFPKLLFSHDELDFIFELTYKDLFIEYNNKIVFLAVYNAYSPDYWQLGKIFMRKYPFIFDYDKKTINFVNIYNINKSDIEKKEKEKKDKKSFSSYLKIIIIIVLIIIGNIIGIIIGKNLWQKSRKKRANELDDDFDYTNDKIGNKNENSKNEEKEKNEDNALYKD